MHCEIKSLEWKFGTVVILAINDKKFQSLAVFFYFLGSNLVLVEILMTPTLQLMCTHRLI